MLVLLGTGIFIYNLGLGFYYFRGVEPLPAFEFLYSGVFLCGVVWWLRAEVQQTRVTQVYCSGMLMSAAWPILIPYHLLKTRGLRGLLPLFALIGAFAFARVLGAVLYVTLFDTF